MTGSNAMWSCMEKRVSLASVQRAASVEGTAALFNGQSEAWGGCLVHANEEQSTGCSTSPGQVRASQDLCWVSRWLQHSKSHKDQLHHHRSFHFPITSAEE